ncbi:MAG TPA: folate-binding protein [Candidatus Nanopelagicaceae bacterium]|nr:folate-binding protein [Candidatus Nanopelagicaceae bacterium]
MRVDVDSGPDVGAAWHFGDVAKEQRALAAGTGFADLRHHPTIAVSGPDRLSWLHSLTTQHLLELPAGQWTQALILSPHGHIEHHMLIVDDGNTSFLSIEPGTALTLLTYLDSMRFMLRVEVADLSDKFALLRMPGAADELGGPYELIPLTEINSRLEQLNMEFTEVGLWALDAERVAAHRPRLGFETDHKTIPNEVGWLDSAVHLNKGCYRGQETVARTMNLGRPPRRLVLLHLDGSEASLPEHGDQVLLGEKSIGFIGTAARHYELGPIALALIKRSTPLNEELSTAGIPAAQEEIVSAT